MNKIDDNTFVRFILNDMTQEELRKTESELLKAGEGATILACSSALWGITPHAFDIVGDVKVKNSSHEDRIKISPDSIKAKEFNNNTTMVQLTVEDGNTIKQIIEAFDASNDSSLTLEENLKAFYLSQCPGEFPEDAENVIAGIKEGIMSFDSAFAQMVSSNDFEVEKITEQMLEGKSLEEKFNILLNFLTALHVLQAENIKVEDGTYNESYDQIKEKLYVADVPVTEEMVAELIVKIRDAMENGTCTLTSAEAVDGLLKSMNKGEEDTKIFVADQEELFKQKMLLSTAIMIGVRNGTISSMAGQDVSPQIIGSGVSAGLEQQKLMADLHSGNTKLDTALTVFKYIGGAALLCAGLYFGIIALVGVTSVFATWALSVFGMSTFACIATWLVGLLFVTWPLSKFYNDALSFVLDKAGQFSDWVVSKFRSKSVDETSFTDWLKFKIESGDVVESDIQSEETQTVFA